MSTRLHTSEKQCTLYPSRRVTDSIYGHLQYLGGQLHLHVVKLQQLSSFHRCHHAHAPLCPSLCSNSVCPANCSCKKHSITSPSPSLTTSDNHTITALHVDVKTSFYVFYDHHVFKRFLNFSNVFTVKNVGTNVT